MRESGSKRKINSRPVQEPSFHSELRPIVKLREAKRDNLVGRFINLRTSVSSAEFRTLPVQKMVVLPLKMIEATFCVSEPYFGDPPVVCRYSTIRFISLAVSTREIFLYLKMRSSDAALNCSVWL